VPGKYKIVYQLPPNLLMAVGMRKQDPDLLAAVDEFLTKIRASGELVALQKKWFGFEMELPK
jgi:polar amino acid transport system substrate-binding protein